MALKSNKSILIPGLYDIAKKLDLPMVCANDVHYLEQEDWKVHNTPHQHERPR